jgi:hypothetical protein
VNTDDQIRKPGRVPPLRKPPTKATTLEIPWDIAPCVPSEAPDLRGADAFGVSEALRYLAAKRAST